MHVQPPERTSAKPLGVFFLIIAVICAIGGFYNTQETAFEGIQHKYIGSLNDTKFKSIQEFSQAGASNPQALADAASDPFIRDAQAELEKLQKERELRMIYCFVPAGLLGIIGLICCTKH